LAVFGSGIGAVCALHALIAMADPTDRRSKDERDERMDILRSCCCEGRIVSDLIRVVESVKVGKRRVKCARMASRTMAASVIGWNV
jgi:hypothetical protein